MNERRKFLYLFFFFVDQHNEEEQTPTDEKDSNLLSRADSEAYD